MKSLLHAIQHLRARLQGPPGFLAALVLFALALGGRFALVGTLPPRGFPFLTFFPAVMITAYLAGLLPGLAASALSILAARYFFIEPVGRLDAASRADLIALAFFACVLVIDCIIVHVMSRAQDRLRSTGEQLRLHVEAQRSAAREQDRHRHAAQDAAERAEAKRNLLNAVFNAVPAGIIVADRQGKLVQMNPATHQIWGLAPFSSSVDEYREWKGWWADDSARHGQRIQPHEWGLARALQGEHCREVVEIEPFGQPGTRLLTQLSAAPILDSSGKVQGGVVAQVDITARKEAEQRARDAALHDPLTGLPNRALIFEYGSHLLAGTARRHGRGALLFIDLDRFKPINDLYGHAIGDEVLREVAARLRACTRQEDLVGRLGGDEFIILLPNMDAQRSRATLVAGNVLDSVSRPYHIGTLELSLAPSIGVSHFPEHADNVGALIHAADLAMYQAKHGGGAGVKVFTAELDTHAEATYALEVRLKKALRQGGFALHYQPIVETRRGRLVGAEALVRLADGEAEEVGPQRFVPVAEAAGLIGPIGEWVLAEACRQHGVWRREDLHVTLAVNVSPLQFRQAGFAERVGAILAEAGVEASCMQLEVTESMIMENIDEAVAILKRIKALGMKIALDDFGTGYSSLSRLSRLPLDKLKVDQSFVRGIESDPASRAVTDAIIALGHSLHLEVIGEGIESDGALRYLQEQGCQQAQGFWFSPPMPAQDFARWCRAREAA